MTFRRPFKHKWFYPLGLSLLLGLAYYSATDTRWQLSRRGPIGLIIIAVGLLYLMVMSWMIWTSKIVVDEQGVRWKEGEDTADLRWDQIRSLVQDGDSLGFIKEGTAWTVKLPFVTRNLYEVLARRLNRLKPEEERILFP